MHKPESSDPNNDSDPVDITQPAGNYRQPEQRAPPDVTAWSIPVEGYDYGTGSQADNLTPAINKRKLAAIAALLMVTVILATAGVLAVTGNLPLTGSHPGTTPTSRVSDLKATQLYADLARNTPGSALIPGSGNLILPPGVTYPKPSEVIRPSATPMPLLPTNWYPQIFLATAEPQPTSIEPDPTDPPSPTEPVPTEPPANTATSPPPPGSGAITFGDSGKTETINCGGAEVTVSGNNNTLTLTGTCSSLTVSGNHNRISLEAPTQITDTGNNNVIE